MRRKLSIFSITLLILLLFGCVEETADLTNPKEYNSNQIFFKYPKNWEISVDTSTIDSTFFRNTEAMVIYQSIRRHGRRSEFFQTFFESAQTEIHRRDLTIRIKQFPKRQISGNEETFEISMASQSRITHFLSKKKRPTVFLVYQVAAGDHPRHIRFHLPRKPQKS